MRVSVFALVAVAAAEDFFQVSGSPGFLVSSSRTGLPVTASFAHAQAHAASALGAGAAAAFGGDARGRPLQASPSRVSVGVVGVVAACAVGGFAVGRTGLSARGSRRAGPSGPRMAARGPSEMEYRKEKAKRDALVRAEEAKLPEKSWLFGLEVKDDGKPKFGTMDDWQRYGGGAIVEKFLYADEDMDTEFVRSDSPLERAMKRKPFKTFNKATGQVELRTWDGKEISTDYPEAELLFLGGSGRPELPVGPEIWDPLQLASPLNGPQINKIYWYRQAEIKHGRVAMAACVGWFFPKAFGLIPLLKNYPGAEVMSDPLATWANLPVQLKASFILSVGIIEFLSEREGTHYMRGGKLGVGVVPLGWDPLNLLKFKGSEESKRLSRLSELKNGRLAMIGIASIYAHSQIPGSVPLLSYWNL